MVTIAAADSVVKTSHVFNLTRPLGLDTGSQHFALQNAVAARVSTMLMELSKMCVEIIVKNSLHRKPHLAQPPWQLSSQP